MEPQTAAAVAAWRRADERLYPVVMVDPRRYTRIVSVIRHVADRLDDCLTVEGLVEARQRGYEVVASSCAAVGVAVESLGDVEAVADAAFGLRHREVEAAQRRRHRIDAVAAARTSGATWVTVDESGSVDQPGMSPYQRVDMCLADGSAIRATVDVDPDSYAPAHALEQLWLDRETGTVTQGSDGVAETFRDRTSWEAAVARWRAATKTRGSNGS